MHKGKLAMKNRACTAAIFSGLAMMALALVLTAAGQTSVQHATPHQRSPSAESAYSRMFRAMEKASSQGDSVALYRIATLKASGDPRVASYPGTAADLLLRSGEQGYLRAELLLGNGYWEGRIVAKDQRQSVIWYTKAAGQGSAEAENMLGNIFMLGGDGVSRNIDVAMEHWQKAADAGDADALLHLGDLYRDGTAEVAPDKKRAFDLLEKSASAGNPEAMSDLGFMYQRGEGVAKSDAEAYRLFKASSADGYAGAKIGLAILCTSKDSKSVCPNGSVEAAQWLAEAGDAGFRQGFSWLANFINTGLLPGTKDEARSWMKKAAEEGDLGAQTWVAQSYLSTDPQSCPRAVFWLNKGVDANYAEALDQLALLYGNGKCVARDPGKAFALALKGANLGSLSAAYHAGWDYDTGFGTAKNPTEAFKWLSKATDSRVPIAACMSAVYLSAGTGTAQDKTKAFTLMKSAADQDFLPAQRNLGEYYRDGIGVSADGTHALNLWVKTADHDSDSALDIAHLYSRGSIGVKKDKRQYKKWLQTSVAAGNPDAIMEDHNNLQRSLNRSNTLASIMVAATEGAQAAVAAQGGGGVYAAAERDANADRAGDSKYCSD